MKDGRIIDEIRPLSIWNPNRDEEDRKILDLCREGETESFARLVEAYKTPIYGIIFRWVQEPQRAEEMTQEVFLKAFRQMKNFRGESKFSTWLFQIAVNLCRDFSRSKKVKKEESLPPEKPIEDPHPQADERVNRKEEIRLLQNALQTLAPIYREALHLRYLNEMSHEEIAQTLGESLSNVKMRVARGLIQLRKKLEENRIQVAKETL
ncbi:MAG: RNA polymerase sigma factor [bacterium]